MEGSRQTVDLQSLTNTMSMLKCVYVCISFSDYWSPGTVVLWLWLWLAARMRHSPITRHFLSYRPSHSNLFFLPCSSTTVTDIETHFRLRDEERANEVRVALESVYHHQHASDAQRLLRYREYARRLLAAKIRDKQQAVARTLDTMISERYLPAYG